MFASRPVVTMLWKCAATAVTSAVAKDTYYGIKKKVVSRKKKPIPVPRHVDKELVGVYTYLVS